jgi:Heterokaryon incompatibility protein (HET)
VSAESQVDTHTNPDLTGHRLPRHADNPSNFLQIKNWLREAFGDKHLYEPFGDVKEWDDAVSPLPKRIVDVSSSPDSSIVHLKDSVNLPQGRYLCLSHCWAESAPMTTTTGTLAQRCDGIRIDGLSPTLRDTVFLARELNIQYIWVDSLCILQDSQDDWEVESSKMGAYYGSSLLTVLAGRDGSKGLFGERDPPPMPYCKFSLPSGPGPTSVNIYFTLFPHRPRRGISNDSPKIYTRGWVLQEEILSPRLLSFEPTQTYFRTSLVEKYESGSVVEAFKSKQLLHPGKWSMLVGEYCKLSLTKESDKLPALSGLAHQYQIRWNDQYLAGLWRNELWRQLQWYVFCSGANVPRRPFAYRAPTWSWASVEGQQYVFFAWIESEKLSYVEILRALTEPSGRDPLGAVKSGILVLRGMLLKGRRRREDKNNVPTPSPAYAFYYAAENNRERRLAGITCDIALEDTPGGGDEEVAFLYLSGNFGLVIRPVAELDATYERIGAISVPVRFNALVLSDLSGLSQPQVINLI